MGNAMAGEQAVPKAADVDLVLDDQYGALGRRLGECGRFWGWLGCRGCPARKVEIDAVAATWLGGDLDASLVGTHDAVDHGEAEPAGAGA
jgi:hypothetical protein